MRKLSLLMLPHLKDRINPSALSGAIDIIVVEHEDGTLRSSPWHICFGVFGLLHHKQKAISVMINEAPAPFMMYVDCDGKGRFFSSVERKHTKETVLYPTIQMGSVAVSPQDIRSFLSKPKKEENKDSDFSGDMIIRDTAVDLEAAICFEEPDPLPMASISSSIDLSQSVSKSFLDEVKTPTNGDPIPSTLLLQTIRHLLHEGRNEVLMTVSSLLQGPKTVMCNLYLMKADDKIVISDVDGTVTASDILGHVLPPMGADWTHPGLVDLYSRMASQGLRFLYLSSRPLGEAAMTREMLVKIRQDGVGLPDGPLILCPDKVIPTFARELSKRPQDFKIPVLANIAKLFEPNFPFVFGLGNRNTDVISYKEVGINEKQIYLFDSSHRVLSTDHTEAYHSLREFTEHVVSVLEECGALKEE